jgi:hypothetical protein
MRTEMVLEMFFFRLLTTWHGSREFYYT